MALYRALPLKREMFDLVIINEATQCNISSCCPAIYRAKRTMITGDIKQLRHYWFLANTKDAKFMERHHLSSSVIC